ncbi:MAG: GNAT family N-acetyltransferase [Proteobacteria bacterium]|nr:GNAT family N-acetyltransferase [Pseudomonadota bacterium]
MQEAIDIREAEFDEAAAIARVQVETWRAAYREIMSSRILEGLNEVRVAAFWAQVLSQDEGRSFILVATVGERVIAFASCGPRQNARAASEGEVYALYVVETMQKQGIGQRLVEASFARLAELGMTSARIWTLRDNRAARLFYERLGGLLAGEGSTDIGGESYVEVAYDWPDLRRRLKPKM